MKEKQTDLEEIIDKRNLFLDKGLDIENKIVFFSNPDNSEDIAITDASVQDLIKKLMLLDKDRHDKEITIYFTSNGGDTDAGFSLYDYIKQCKSPTKIIIMGKCFSMSSIILQAANKRIMQKNSTLMIHDGSLAVDSEAKNTEKRAEYNKYQRFLCYEILLEKMKNVKRNNKLPEKIKQIMEKSRMLFSGKGYTINEIEMLTGTDLYLTAEEALRLHLIDEIIN